MLKKPFLHINEETLALSHLSPSTQFVLHQANDLFVFAFGKQTAAAVVACVEPGTDVASNVLVEILMS